MSHYFGDIFLNETSFSKIFEEEMLIRKKTDNYTLNILWISGLFPTYCQKYLNPYAGGG